MSPTSLSQTSMLQQKNIYSDFGFGGRLSSSQDFKFALANLQKNFEKLAAKTDTNKMDDFLKLEVGKLKISSRYCHSP